MEETFPFEARLLHDFEAENEYELSVKEGTIITVQDIESGWYITEINGKMGIVPQTYVERMDKQIVPQTHVEREDKQIEPKKVEKKDKKKHKSSKKSLKETVDKKHTKKSSLPIEDDNPKSSTKTRHVSKDSQNSIDETSSPSVQRNSISISTQSSTGGNVSPNRTSPDTNLRRSVDSPLSRGLKQPPKGPIAKGSLSPVKLGPKKVPMPPGRKKDGVLFSSSQEMSDIPPKALSMPKLPPKPSNQPLTSSIPPSTSVERPSIPPKSVSSRTMKSHPIADPKRKSVESKGIDVSPSGRLSSNSTEAVIVEESVAPTEDNEQRRYYIVKEILTTEKRYIAGLEEAIQTFYKPLLEASRKEGAEADVKTLFSTMEHILPLNKTLLNSLQEKVGNWSPEQTIGDVFLRFAPFLKMYTTYSNNYDSALEVLNRLSNCQWFLAIVEMKIKVETYIITPIQRIPRYSLLLADLLKHTPSKHKDRVDISKALEIVKDVASHVNRSVGIHKNVSRLTDAGLAHLLAPHRVLLRDGTIHVIAPENEKVKKRIIGNDKAEKKKMFYHFLLFNDTISYVNQALDESLMPKKEKKGFRLGKGLDSSKLKYKRVTWPLYLVWLKDIGLSSGFELFGPTTQFTMYFSSTEERDAWWNALNDCIYKELVKIHENLADSKNIASTFLVRQGKYEFNTGEVYEGSWKQGKIFGEGTMKCFGATYQGTFENGFRVGKGTINYQTGQVYTGSWKDGKPLGKGVMKYLNKSEYEGDFKDGRRHGKGVFKFDDGSQYDGEWRNDHAHGAGDLVLKNGTKYQGNFMQGLYQGKGSLTYPNGEVYNGFLQNGVRYGRGAFQYSDGSKYEGDWKDDRRHGHGTFSSSKESYDGEWKYDLREGKGTMRFSSGDTYEGGWSSGRPHGYGVWTYKNSQMTKYEGEYNSGKRSGKGTAYYTDGSKYEGEWSDDIYSGYGKYYTKNGCIYEGKWSHGCLETKVTIKKPNNDEKLSFDSSEDTLSYNIVSQIPSFVFTHTRL